MKELIYNDLRFKVPEDVYLPADDSFLIEEHSSLLKGTILDVGCGSGFLSITNAKQNPNNKVTGVDINPIAVKTSKQNAKLNKIKNTKFIQSDLFEKLESQTFDGIIFNPPYLPTSKQEKLGNDLNHAFDGGLDGRRIVDKFLTNFYKHLNKKGTLLILQSSSNNPKKTIKKLEQLNLKTEKLSEISFFFEKLMVLKAKKP